MTILTEVELDYQLKSTNEIIQRVTGIRPRFARPPYGNTNATVQKAMAKHGLREVIWTQDSYDWAEATPDSILNQLTLVPPGGTFVMHDRKPNTLAAISWIDWYFNTYWAASPICAGRLEATTNVQPVLDWPGLFFFAHAADPVKDLVVNFGPTYGIWVLRQTSWMQVHGWSAKTIVSGDFDGNGQDDLAIDFFPNAGVWLWMNHSTWVAAPFPGLNVTTMAVGDFDHNGQSDLVLSSPGYGVWMWKNNTTWVGLHSVEALHLAVGDIDGNGSDDLLVDFVGFGLWALKNNTTWSFLHSL